MTFTRRHLFGLEDLSSEEIEHILDTAFSFKEVLERPIRIVPTLRGVSVLNLFFEDSTRTRISFELAEKRLSAEITNFTKGSSSVSKGESLRDTARNIEAMKVDLVVVRHSSPGTPQFLARHLDCGIINAGDGQHEHPTQALLDIMTMKERFGNIKGLKVVILGDILHSRVARSDIFGLKKMGAEVILCGPTTLLPRFVNALGVETTTNLEEALDGADVLYILRIQKEREKHTLFPSLQEYVKLYGITRSRLAVAKEDIVIMHPGPINRGIEVSYEIADSPGALILDQVTNGVAVRMAVLYLLSGRAHEKQS